MERVLARASGRDNPSESRNPRLSLKNLHVRDRPILAGASGQVSVPDLRNSFCWKVDPPHSWAAIYIRGWRRWWKATAGFNAHASCIFKAPAWYSCTRKLNPNARLRTRLPSSSFSRYPPRLSVTWIERVLSFFPDASSAFVAQVSLIENQNSGELVG